MNTLFYLRAAESAHRTNNHDLAFRSLCSAIGELEKEVTTLKKAAVETEDGFGPPPNWKEAKN